MSKKFKVIGNLYVTVEKEVEIDESYLIENGYDVSDEDSWKEAAFEKAYDDFGGITSFVGNGGYDKLIGVYGHDESIYGDGEVDFTEVEES